jgi:hypothetical protein
MQPHKVARRLYGIVHMVLWAVLAAWLAILLAVYRECRRKTLVERFDTATETPRSTLMLP